MTLIKPVCSARVNLFALGVLLTPLAAHAEISGNVALEARAFTRSPLVAQQTRQQVSVSGQLEYSYSWDNDKQRFTFTPFARLDSADNERSHADIRELAYVRRSDESHEWRIGIRKVFWGVTESQHLVDIINQTDLVEDLDGEEKLGQPMINLALFGDWGSLDTFILTGFRERTFPGDEGRLRSSPMVESSRSSYQAANRSKHTDLAMRWAKSTGTFDAALSYFYGTSREPRFNAVFDGSQIVLAPHYDLIKQSGVELQKVQDATLLKMEAIHRSSSSDSYWASTVGLEHTLSDWLHSGKDLGLIAEHLYDQRGASAATPFQDDIMLGLRLAFNDAGSSEALLGVIGDRHSTARIYTLETSWRVGDYWKWSLKARLFDAIPAQDLLYSSRRDDFIKLEWARYF